MNQNQISKGTKTPLVSLRLFINMINVHIDDVHIDREITPDIFKIFRANEIIKLRTHRNVSSCYNVWLLINAAFSIDPYFFMCNQWAPGNDNEQELMTQDGILDAQFRNDEKPCIRFYHKIFLLIQWVAKLFMKWDFTKLSKLGVIIGELMQ